MSGIMSCVRFRQRGTLRSFASASGISKSILGRVVESGKVHRKSSTVKPYIKYANKTDCEKFAFIQSNIPCLPFQGMLQYVQVNEKWFCLTKEKQNY